MTDENTRELVAKIDGVLFETAKHIVETCAEHVPMVMCFPGGPVVNVAHLMHDDRTKEMLGELIARYAKRFDIVCLVSEGWAVVLENEKDQAARDLVAAGVSPSEHPNRIEVLTVVYHMKGGGTAFAHHKITHEGKARSLERAPLLFGESVGRLCPSGD